MIPMDVLQLIVQSSPLSVRYLWSLVCRKYKITEYEWGLFGQQYKLTKPTKENIRGICQRYYGVQCNITKHTRHLWSEHLLEPLTVWSPWTPASACSHNRIFFRKYSFVAFVQDLKSQFKLTSRCLRVRKNEINILVNVRVKRIPMVYICSRTKKRMRKIHISSAFKKMKSVRALIAFHVGAGQLHLNVRGLEFLT